MFFLLLNAWFYTLHIDAEEIPKLKPSQTLALQDITIFMCDDHFLSEEENIFSVASGLAGLCLMFLSSNLIWTFSITGVIIHS